MTLKKTRASAALGTAIALSLGGVLVGSTSATAQDSSDAPTTGAAYDSFAKTLLADESVQGVAQNADGDITVLAVKGESSDAATNAAASYDNVDVEWLNAPLEAFAATDIVGGAGYLVDTPGGRGACSVGFAAWTPAGAPALITAGHCVNDSADTSQASTNPRQSLPSSDPAVGGPGFVDAGTGAFGAFGFSQYGGKNNSAGVEGNKAESLDVAVVDVAPGVVVKPEVTDWTTAASNDLSASTTHIRSVGTPAINKPISKSGRTTGVTSDASVDYVNGWYDISGHQVYGAGIIGLNSDHGDSGGAIFQGTTAVGILSGGGTVGGKPFTVAADLVTALEYSGGYTVQLHLDAPVVTSPATITSNDKITGTGPASSTITVTPAGGTAFDVTTNAKGAWSFPVTQIGNLSYSLATTNGFNTSAATTHNVTVTLAAPIVNVPNGVTAKPNAITGTGLPGSTVTLTGDLTGTTTVGADGSWSIPATLEYGKSYEVVVTLAVDPANTQSTTQVIDVVLAKPVITSPAHASTLDVAPTAVSGTGVTDAVVTVTVDGTEISARAAAEYPVVAGEWSAPLSALALGEHTIEVTQSIDGVSATGSTTFTLTEKAATGGNGGGTTGGNAGGTLAQTGAESGIALGALGLLVAAGGAAMIIGQRRRATTKAPTA